MPFHAYPDSDNEKGFHSHSKSSCINAGHMVFVFKIGAQCMDFGSFRENYPCC